MFGPGGNSDPIHGIDERRREHRFGFFHPKRALDVLSAIGDDVFLGKAGAEQMSFRGQNIEDTHMLLDRSERSADGAQPRHRLVHWCRAREQQQVRFGSADDVEYTAGAPADAARDVGHVPAGTSVARRVRGRLMRKGADLVVDVQHSNTFEGSFADRRERLHAL